MPPLITLLTDFGLADSYAAEVKGVLLSRAPGVTLVDVSHEVPPGDVRVGQFVLSRTWNRFPAGTVHLVVVDPGLARRAAPSRRKPAAITSWRPTTACSRSSRRTRGSWPSRSSGMLPDVSRARRVRPGRGAAGAGWPL
jgi:hypothetical protein